MGLGQRLDRRLGWMLKKASATTPNNRRAFKFVLAAGTIALACIVSLTPVLHDATWPMNHEGNSFFLRTLVYASHMQQGDYAPIWSAADNEGFGSPLPAFYHKLFYLVSGCILALGASAKASIVGSIIAFLIVGAVGCLFLCREVGCNYLISLCGAVILVFANYTVTNWLIRGAMAEFAAAMIVPWAIAGFIASIKKAYIVPALPISIFLLFLAHSVLAYFVFLILTAVFFILLPFKMAPYSILFSRRTVLWFLFVCIIVSPYLIVMHELSGHYDMSRLIPEVYLPWNQIKPLSAYFWDPDWKWGKSWNTYTVALDLPLLALAAIGLGRLFFAAYTRYCVICENSLPFFVLGSILFITLILQTSAMSFVYRWIPGAPYLQFPWRLSSITVPTLIAFALLTVQLGFKQKDAVILSALAVALVVLTGGNLSEIRYPNLNIPKSVEALRGISFSAFGEYVPLERKLGKAPSRRKLRGQTAQEGCGVQEVWANPESVVKEFKIKCKHDSTVVLPIFFTESHQIDIGEERRSCARRDHYPSLCAVAVGPGKTVVRVHSPTMLAVMLTAGRRLTDGFLTILIR